MGELAEAARRILASSLPPAVVDGQPAERPTLLPLPGELPPNDTTNLRLNRLARFGSALDSNVADRSEPQKQSGQRSFESEARLFFNYLRGAYQAAAVELDNLEPQLTTARERLALLSLRAQLFWARGNRRKPAPSSIISSLVATRIGARWKRRRTGWFSRRPSVHSRSGLSTSPRWRPRPSSPSRRSIAIFPVTFSTLASSFLLTPRGRRLSNVAADRFRSHLFRAESCPDFVRDLDVARTIGYAPGKKLFAKSLTFGSRFNGTVREAWEVAADGMVELGLGDRVP